MDAIDDNSVDINRLCNRIIHGVMHHPAQRDMGEDGARDARGLIFESVQEWWRNMDNGQREDYKRKLSRDGVFKGENHKEGVHDTGHGHGCSGKLEMRKLYGEPETVETKIAGAAAGAIFSGATGLVSNMIEQQTGYKLPNSGNSQRNDEEHGLSGFLHKAGNILKEAFDKDEERPSQSQGSYGRQDSQNSYQQENQSQSYGRQDSQNSYQQESQSQSYSRQDNGRQDNGHQDDNYGRQEETSSGRQESQGSYGRQESNQSGSHHNGRRHDNSSDNYGRQESSYGRNDSSNYGRQESSNGRQDDNYGRQGSSYGREDDSYGRQESSGRQHGGNRNDDRREDSNGREDSYGRRDDDENDGGRRQHHGRSNNDSYGRY